MSNIIQLQFGQYGNRIGDTFWSLLRDEHYLDTNGALKANSPAAVTQNIGVFFHEQSENKFVPRALLVDLEPGVLQSIRSTNQNFYNPDNFIYGDSGAGNNWAKGHYTEGAELADQVMDAIRAEIERSDRLHGFQMIHSISGGTGSGMGTLILTKLREEYTDRMFWTYSVAGTNRSGDSVAHVYNNVLGLHQLIENADTVIYFEDDAAYSRSWNNFKINTTYHHLTTLWATLISDITSGMRFPTQSRQDLRKLSTNLVPFPRPHFLAAARSPLSANFFENRKEITTINDTIMQLFDKKNLLLECNDGGKHMAASCIFRGDIPLGDIDDQIARMQSKNSPSFIKWIPDNIKTSLCSISPVNLNISGTALINTTAIVGSFQAMAQRFNAMFRRKAFLHWFTGEGMDEMEFSEAESNLHDLICEYQMCPDSGTNSHYNSDDEVE